MKFIKKNLNIILVTLILILIIGTGIFVKVMFFPSNSKAIYGNRLEKRDKVKITDKQKNEVKEKLKDSTKKVTVRIAGRIIYIEMEVNEDVSVDASKDLGNKSLEAFSDEEKAYYDIQVMIDKASDQDHFPVLGYKHHTKTDISWTKNR